MTDRVEITTDDVWPEDTEEEAGVVVNWFVSEGATVAAGETICELQVEKVDVDVQAPAAGTLVEIALDENDEFGRGETIAIIEPT